MAAIDGIKKLVFSAQKDSSLTKKESVVRYLPSVPSTTELREYVKDATKDTQSSMVAVNLLAKTQDALNGTETYA